MIIASNGKIHIGDYGKVEESRETKSLDIDELLGTNDGVITGRKHKTSEAQLRAVAKYEKNFKRINCRLTPEMYQQIVDTGKTTNAVIVEALTAYFEKR